MSAPSCAFVIAFSEKLGMTYGPVRTASAISTGGIPDSGARRELRAIALRLGVRIGERHVAGAQVEVDRAGRDAPQRRAVARPLAAAAVTARAVAGEQAAAELERRL